MGARVGAQRAAVAAGAGGGGGGGGGGARVCFGGLQPVEGEGNGLASNSVTTRGIRRKLEAGGVPLVRCQRIRWLVSPARGNCLSLPLSL